MEEIDDSWIIGENAPVSLSANYFGDLDGHPGDEHGFSTWYTPDGDDWSYGSNAYHGGELPPPGASTSEAADRVVVCCGATADHWQRLGDFNGDGVDDVLILQDSSSSMYGQASLLLGPISDWPAAVGTQDDFATTIWPYYHEEDVPEFGDYAAFGGDINGDGLPDAVIRSKGEVKGYLLVGRTDPLDGQADLANETHFNYIHEPIGFSGDQDGDGLTDLMMGDTLLNYWIAGADIKVGESNDIKAVYTALWTEDGGACQEQERLNEILPLGDWSGDGITDVALICAKAAGAPDGAHAIHILDGAGLAASESDTNIWDLSLGSYAGGAEPHPGLAFTVDDLDLDGKRDLVISALTGFTNSRGGNIWDAEQTLLPSSAGLPGPYDPWPENALRFRTNLGTESTSDLHFAGMGDHNADGFLDLAVGVAHDPATSTIDPDLGDVSWHYLLGWDIPWDDPLYW